ncbi:MAG TPA: GEVED domain-containing protein, partial [Tahibacter sp.]|nr:GEVED domain-containing protein [Tahibacter sp.]
MDGINVSCATLASDYGDAPASYGTPSHEIDAAVYLGATADGESASQPNATASGDDAVGGTAPNPSIDDEDGVAAFPTLVANAGSYSVDVTATNHLPAAAATLVGWIDFNRNGTFDATEAASAAVPAGTTTGTFTLTWNGVSGLTTSAGATYARFRLSSAALSASTPSGAVANGEVEDYALTILPGLTLNKTTQIRVGGPFDFTLTNTGQTTGTATTTAVNTAVQVDGDTGTAGTQSYAISSTTAAVTINESALPVGWQIGAATCVNAVGTTVGSLAGTTYTIAAADVAASKSFSCTFTNRPVSSTLQLAKSWTNGRTGDVASIGATIGGTDNTGAFTATAPTAANSGTAVTVYAGDVVTLPAETMTTGMLANYATTLNCTGATPSGTNGQAENTLTVPNTSSTIVCTYDNARRSATLQLAKTWQNAVSGNVASIGATTGGPNSTAAFTATAPAAGNSGPAVAVYAGDTLTLPAETMTTGTLANYTTTVSCGGGTLSGTNGQVAGNTLGVSAADEGAAIVCTYANAHKPLVDVEKTVDASTPNPIGANQDAVFNLTVRNTATGTTQPAGYQFLEVVPQHTTFTAIGGGTTDCALPAAAGTLCAITVTAPIVAGTPQVVVVTMRTVDPLPTGVAQLFNLATQGTTPPPGCAASGQVCATPPTTCAAPQTCATVPLRVVNLAVDKTATPGGTYLPGQSLDYAIVVTNNGPAAASGIGVTDTVPANVAVASWTCTTSGAGNDCDTTAAGTGATGATN